MALFVTLHSLIKRSIPSSSNLRSRARLRLGRRVVALLLLGVLALTEGVGLVPGLRAETGGATAPEVTKFEPVGTTDLVNLASGDFAYSLPIINVPGPEGGYPLALSYHAGIQHAEEASWVGLGWNLQPGSITRGVKGYPDDFRDIGINTNYLSNVYETSSISVSAFGVTAGVNYTSYKGLGGSIGFSVGIGYNLGFASANASIGISAAFAPGGGTSFTASANASISFGAVSIGVSASTDLASGKSSVNTSVGVDISAGHKKGNEPNESNESNKRFYKTGILGPQPSASLGYGGSSSSFSSYSGGGNHSKSFGIGISFCGFGFGVSHTRSWIDKNEVEKAYGYYYHTAPGESGNRINEWTLETDPDARPGDSKEHALAPGLHYLPSSDGYGVMAQGTGGALKLTRIEDRVWLPRRRKADEWREAMSWPWPWPKENTVPIRYRPRFVFMGDNTETFQDPRSVGDLAEALDGWLNRTDAQGNLVPFDLSQHMAEQDLTLAVGKDHRPGSRLVKEVLDERGRFVGFHIWETDGKHYHFGEPVWMRWTETISANKDKIGQGEWFRSKSRITEPYAYAWYLSDLRYPDYWDRTGDGFSDDDSGGWVRFQYLIGSSNYTWHTSPDGQLNDGPINRVDKLGKDKAGMMYGMQTGQKQLKYLNSIETATHKAFFVVSPRKDAQEIPNRNQSMAFYLENGEKNGEFKIRAYDTRLLGFEVENVSPEADDYWDINEYSQVNNVGGVCDGTINVKHLATYKKPNMISLNLNGLPIVIDELKYSYELSYHEEQSPEYGQGNICKDSLFVEYVVTFDVSKQFWNEPTAHPNSFKELRGAWSQLVASRQVKTTPPSMMKLDDIYLVEKSTNRLVKQVHFTYTYELAKGVPNSFKDPITGQAMGKLTLAAVQTFGQEGMVLDAQGNPDLARSAALPPYRFYYDHNPGWRNKYSYDRWGFYKSNGAPWQHRDVNPEDQSAWCLTRILLPTGGSLHIQYEAKDYTRVQDRIPNNPRANGGAVGRYLVDLNGWLNNPAYAQTGGGLAAGRWPVTQEQWNAFRHYAETQPLTIHRPGGVSGVVSAVTTRVPQTRVPVASAPNPRDLKLRMIKTSEAYRARLSKAPAAIGAAPLSTVAGSEGVPDVDPASTDPLPVALAGTGSAEATVERMVTLHFEYWTAGERAQRTLGQPFEAQDPASSGLESPVDRGDLLIRSVVARLRTEADGGAKLYITDPTFDWPKEAPNALTVTWSANATMPKVGGGVRVKRIVSFDGRRSYTTSYTYTDFVDGRWTSSGVAAQEPPPFGFSAQDDRVIQTEKGGWANEGGGGIIHSRVIVRHGWSEDPTPAGVQAGSGHRTWTPMGESVFRFLTPKDVPHRQQDVQVAKTVETQGLTVTNSVRLTEIFNMASWWGQLLWKEDRDAQGRVLNRMENRFTQLEGYLRTFADEGLGYDLDLEKAYGNAPRPDTSYRWAQSQGSQRNLPLLARHDHPEGASQIGVDFPGSNRQPGYLNGSLNVTVIGRSISAFGPTLRSLQTRYPEVPRPNYDLLLTDPDRVSDAGLELGEPGETLTGWHASVSAVREINLPPLVSEVRTYGEGYKLMGVVRNTLWDARTGALLESWSRGRKADAGGVPTEADPFHGHEVIVTRNWPAYWVYPAMDKIPDGENALQPYSEGLTEPWGKVSHQLSQMAQNTTLRLGVGAADTPSGRPEHYLNSKVETWWQPEGGEKSGRFVRGGDFVWNGLGQGANPKPTPFFQDTLGSSWTPAALRDSGTPGSALLQPYQSNGNWLFAGATTRYDAFAHAVEAVDGDGLWGCSHYGYPYGLPPSDDRPARPTHLPAGVQPIAKFANARLDETAYWNFESVDPGNTNCGTAWAQGDHPITRLTQAYTGFGAWDPADGRSFCAPSPEGTGRPDRYEVRAFVKAANREAALSRLTSEAEWKDAVRAEGGWWFLRARVLPGAVLRFSGGLVDDLAVLPWRRQGAPASVSHYSYDPTLGLVTSITGSNGRTTRYQYDGLGRLKTVFDPYGKATAATRYSHAVSAAAPAR